MDLTSTLAGSPMENFLPAGWNLREIDRLAALSETDVVNRQPWWHPQFELVPCRDYADFDTLLGHEIAREIHLARLASRPLILILPVGPMGMYRWTVFFLKEWDVHCDHVHGFNMDEWSDAQGNTLPSTHSGSFQFAMENAFYGRLASLAVPAKQRHFAWKNALPAYAEQIAELRKQGGRLVTVFGIGRVCHIAFWEPTFAAEYPTETDWRKQTHRLGARLHPLTIEQNALTSFKSRTTLVPAYANTIGPGLFLAADRVIGGADGAFGRRMQWQGLSLRMTLHHRPTPWIPSSYMPGLPGRLFCVQELLEPLVAECN